MPRISHDLEILGTYTNSDGKERQVFLRWNKEKKGYVMLDLLTNKVIQFTVFQSLQATPKSFKDSGTRRDSTVESKELVAA